MKTIKSSRRFDYTTVVNVIDGDTLDIDIDLGFTCRSKQRFRLARIDTPERGQPGWAEATEFLKRSALGRTASLEVTKTDKYGRYLCELFIDGVNVNDLLLASGLAKLYV